MSAHEVLGGRPPSPLVENKLRQDTRRSVTLLVESGFDQRFWRMYAHEYCKVQHQGQGGREAALRELDKAKGHADSRMIAVLDADLDRAEGRLVERPDVVWTDAHDLETTLVSLPLLEKLVAHWVDSDKFATVEASWAETVRHRLFRHALGMGRLRWYKLRQGMDDIVFKKPGKGSKKGELLYFDEYRECAEKSWEPSIEKMLRAVLNYSNAQSLLSHDFQLGMRALPEAEDAQVCNGHDLVGFLQVWLMEAGAYPRNAEGLAGDLLIACEKGWLRQTQMWRLLKSWEEANPGYLALKET